LIILLLIVAGFVLLLLGVHYSVRSRQQPAAAAAAAKQQPSPQSSSAQGLQAGREMTTTTNVNLREGPGVRETKIGEVEMGSKVRILRVSGNWVEVDILQRGFPRRDEGGPSQGWIDGARLR
jgi:uncharacterized protein YgiM (DUF1202 family)